MAPTPDPNWTPANAPYVPIARRIVQRIAGLGTSIPPLAGFGGSGVYLHEDNEISSMRLFGRVLHEHGAHAVPNPAYDPSHPERQVPQSISEFDPTEGLSVDMYFYTGQWLGISPVQPVSIGRLHIVVYVSSPNRALADRVRQAIDQVITTEQATFARGNAGNSAH